MYVRHVGSSNKIMMVSDSYLQVHDNYDNYDDQTGINAPLTYEDFAAALAAASTNTTTIIVDRAVIISDDETIPANIHLVIRKGGSFSVASGKTLTISGTVDSCGQERGTIFTGLGTVAYSSVTAFVGKILFEEAPVDGNQKFIEVSAYAINLTQGMRQAAIQVSTTRYADYAMTATDGNFDMGMKITSTNRSASPGFSKVRALEITGNLRDAGSASEAVEGLQCCAKTRSGTTVVSVCAARFLIDHGANGSGSIVGVQVQDVSQSGTGTMYGILLNTSSYNITREYGIFIDSGAGSWTNAMSFNGVITNVFDFENIDGTNGAGFDAGFTNPAAYVVPDGYIQVNVGGNTLYAYLYPDKPT
ncbi:MAG: hypothetical protein IMF13_06780 [Proteobacteria bacterium]|nr:hypothetical protein [Pseudomonadota bacterium]